MHAARHALVPRRRWSQLRLDLLHRTAVPWEAKRPQLFASGVVNAYHASLGVRTRERLQRCAGPRFSMHFHHLYFSRFYSTEEHCSYRRAPRLVTVGTPDRHA